MERAIFVRMKKLFMGVTAISLAACTGAGSPEGDRPDSVALTVPAEPAGALAPVQAESIASAPVAGPRPTASPPVQRRPAQSEPVLKQPPPPRDTRPSIPWPPDTL